MLYSKLKNWLKLYQSTGNEVAFWILMLPSLSLIDLKR